MQQKLDFNNNYMWDLQLQFLNPGVCCVICEPWKLSNVRSKEILNSDQFKWDPLGKDQNLAIAECCYFSSGFW